MVCTLFQWSRQLHKVNIKRMPGFTIFLYLTVILAYTGTARAVCLSGEVRLSPDNSTEYCYSGEWRRLCTASEFWTDNEASVICRQLGYSDQGYNAGFVCRRSTAMDTVPYFKVNSSCDGTENRLQDCGDISNQTRCECEFLFFSTPVGEIRPTLTCTSDCTNGDIRLEGGDSNHEGRVEVCVEGHWRTVCNKGHEGIAGAVCSQLGFPHERAVSVSSFGPGYVPISNCTVQPDSSLSCSPISDTSCDHSMDLGVICHTEVVIIPEPEQPITTEKTTNLIDISVTTDQPLTTDKPSSEELNCDSLAQQIITNNNHVIAVLGTTTGVLAILLILTLMMLVLTCVTFKKREAAENCKENGPGLSISNKSNGFHHTNGKQV